MPCDGLKRDMYRFLGIPEHSLSLHLTHSCVPRPVLENCIFFIYLLCKFIYWLHVEWGNGQNGIDTAQLANSRRTCNKAANTYRLSDSAPLPSHSPSPSAHTCVHVARIVASFNELEAGGRNQSFILGFNSKWDFTNLLNENSGEVKLWAAAAIGFNQCNNWVKSTNRCNSQEEELCNLFMDLTYNLLELQRNYI